MNPDVVKSTVTSLVTTVLSLAGGYLMGAGYVTADQWASISGGVIVLAGIIAYKASQHTVAQSVDKVNAAGGIAAAPGNTAK